MSVAITLLDASTVVGYALPSATTLMMKRLLH